MNESFFPGSKTLLSLLIHCFPALMQLWLQAIFIVIALPLCLGVERQLSLGIVSVAVSLPCPYLDFALPPLLLQIPITRV